MRAWIAIGFLAGCSGGDSGGSFDATVHDAGAAMTFSQSCDLTATTEFWDALATGDSLAFELKWKQTAITVPGTYTSTGIVPQISVFVLHGDQEISSASGTVTFDTYDPPTAVTGTFMASIGDTFDASGSFDCR